MKKISAILFFFASTVIFSAEFYDEEVSPQDSQDFFEQEILFPSQDFSMQPELERQNRFEARRQAVYNPFATASLSLIPGLGQAATGNFAKGAFFLTTEGIIGWIAYRAWGDYRRSYRRIYVMRDSLNIYRTLEPPQEDADIWARNTAFWANRTALAEYNNLFQRTRYHNAAFMFGAVGIWNLMDAVGVSNAVSGAQNPDPRRAMALSAIPFSGAGQIYNGEWFKAGLVMATQTSFVFGGLRFQRLMAQAQRFPQDLNGEESFSLLPSSERTQPWRDNHRNAARRRTMFFWYAIISYIYGMTDAYVDAALSGFEQKFDLTFDISPFDEEISFGLQWNFGTRTRGGGF